MSEKTLNKLLVAVAALAVFYGLLLFWQYRQTAPGVAVPISTSGLGRSADRLSIKSGGHTVILTRRGDRWYAGKQRVGEIKISTFLQALDKLVFVRVVTSKAVDLKTYGLDKQSSNILKVYRGKQLLRSLHFGSMSAANSFYVRADSSPAVYEAEGDLIFEVGQPVSGWAKPERRLK